MDGLTFIKDITEIQVSLVDEACPLPSNDNIVALDLNIGRQNVQFVALNLNHHFSRQKSLCLYHKTLWTAH